MSDDKADRIIDVEHLASQTLHDDALRDEILTMFIAQMKDVGAQLASLTPQARRDIAHRLKGTANAIGAFELARASTALMEFPQDEATLNRFGIAAQTAGRAARRLIGADGDTPDG